MSHTDQGRTLALFPDQIDDDTISPSKRDPSVWVFTSRRRKDGASELCVKSAGQDSFHSIARAVMPKLYPVRKFFHSAGRHATP